MDKFRNSDFVVVLDIGLGFPKPSLYLPEHNNCIQVMQNREMRSLCKSKSPK